MTSNILENLKEKLKALLRGRGKKSVVQIKTVNVDNKNKKLLAFATESEHNLTEEYLVDQKEFKKVTAANEMSKKLTRAIVEKQEHIKCERKPKNVTIDIMIKRRFMRRLKILHQAR